MVSTSVIDFIVSEWSVVLDFAVPVWSVVLDLIVLGWSEVCFLSVQGWRCMHAFSLEYQSKEGCSKWMMSRWMSICIVSESPGWPYPVLSVHSTVDGNRRLVTHTAGASPHRPVAQPDETEDHSMANPRRPWRRPDYLHHTFLKVFKVCKPQQLLKLHKLHRAHSLVTGARQCPQSCHSQVTVNRRALSVIV